MISLCQIPSIHFLYLLNASVGSRGAWSLSQRSWGERRGLCQIILFQSGQFYLVNFLHMTSIALKVGFFFSLCFNSQVKWHEICLSIPAAILEVLNAWENGVLSVEAVQVCHPLTISFFCPPLTEKDFCGIS